jgi:hypothetical protein
MKYFCEKLLCSAIIFLSLSFNFFAIGDNDKNIEKIFNQFVERAKLFGNITEKGDSGDLAKMFQSNQSDSIIIIQVIKNKPVVSNDDEQNYYLKFGNVSIELDFFWTDDATITNFKNIKESDNLEHVLAASTDFGQTVGKVEGRVFFRKEGSPKKCNIIYNVYHKQGEKQISSVVEWDDKGNIITKKEWNLVTEKKVTVPPVSRDLQEKFANNENGNKSKTFFSFKPIKFPKINDKKIDATFKRIEYLANMKRPRDLAQLANWELTKKEQGGEMLCINGKIRGINFKTGITGYNLSIDENGKITAYSEGSFTNLEERKFEKFYKNQEKSRQYYWYMHNCFYVLRKGVEIKFHPNGYPSTYNTIVNNRLYGRQIEWNDKGEIISDVDLDIPKELGKDTPKKLDNSIKK